MAFAEEIYFDQMTRARSNCPNDRWAQFARMNRKRTHIEKASMDGEVPREVDWVSAFAGRDIGPSSFGAARTQRQEMPVRWRKDVLLGPLLDPGRSPLMHGACSSVNTVT